MAITNGPVSRLLTRGPRLCRVSTGRIVLSGIRGRKCVRGAAGNYARFNIASTATRLIHTVCRGRRGVLPYSICLSNPCNVGSDFTSIPIGVNGSKIRSVVRLGLASSRRGRLRTSIGILGRRFTETVTLWCEAAPTFRGRLFLLSKRRLSYPARTRVLWSGE